MNSVQVEQKPRKYNCIRKKEEMHKYRSTKYRSHCLHCSQCSRWFHCSRKILMVVIYSIFQNIPWNTLRKNEATLNSIVAQTKTLLYSNISDIRKKNSCLIRLYLCMKNVSCGFYVVLSFLHHNDKVETVSVWWYSC